MSPETRVAMFGQITAQTGSVLERVKSAAEYFQNPELTTADVVMLLAGLAAVAAAVVIAKLTLDYRVRKAVYLPAADVRDPKKILQILDLCIVRRSKLEFKVTSRQNNGQIVSGMPEAIRGNHIIVAMSVAFSPAQEKLKGERIHCYFKVRQNKHTAFFNFLSNIATVRAGDGGFLELAVALPEVLVAGQKRNFLRMDPPDDFILEISLWPEYSGSDTEWPTKIDALPPPLLSNVDKGPQYLRISDISAGGARLVIDKPTLAETELAPAKGARFMLLLSLWDPVELNELALWMICRIQKYVSASDNPKADLGVQFIAWSQLKDPENRELTWINIDPEDGEVPPLGNWVAKRYLEEYRKSLVAE